MGVFKRILAFALLVFFVANNVGVALAKPNTDKPLLNQRTVFDRGISDYNVSDCAPPQTNDPNATTATVNGPVYIVGDSITDRAKDYYNEKFKDMSPTVEGLGNRHIEQNNPSPSGIGQIQQDAEKVSKAKVIVVALGTNDTGNTPASVKKSADAMMRAIKKANNGASIYWVNVLNTLHDTDSKQTNAAIKDAVGSDGEIIDWYTTAKDKADLGSFNEGVHPTKKKDFELLVNLVYDSIKSDNNSGNSSSSQDVQVNYIAAGKIPVKGLTVGATTYGGVYKDGKWQPSNDVQGGVKPYDDNGVNSYNGKPIAGHTAFAELGGGTLLGSLPYQKNGKPNTKLQITYKGKSIIAEKVDIGTGQAGNDHYKVDLWWETAKLLGVTDNVDIKIHAVPDDTPVTPLDGAPKDTSVDATAANSVACHCGSGTADSSATLVENADTEQNMKNIFQYFVQKGYKDFQAAGIVGNVYAESSGSPTRYQGDEKDYKLPPSPKPGWGIVQWTPNSKLIEYAKSVNKEPHLLSTQLDFLYNQLEGKAGQWSEKQAGDDLKSTTSVVDAVRAFQGDSKIGGKYGGFERPADEQGSLQKRINRAKLTLKKYGGTTSSGDSSSTDSSSGSSGAVCSCDATQAANPADVTKLNSTLQDLGSKAAYKTAISVAALNSDLKADYNGDNTMPTRSSYKIYTAYATLRAIEDGKISWSSTVNAPKWPSQSVETTMQNMIEKSNNDAAEALRTDSRIGNYKEVTRMLQNDVGLSSKTVMGSSSYASPAGTNSNSTANDYVKFLTLLYKKKLKGVDKDSNYAKLIGFMKKASTDNGGSGREGIVKGVGRGTEVADKPGWASGSVDPASNDVGIVYLKGNPYVISILTSAPNDFTNVAKIAKEVNKQMGGATGASGGDCANAGSVQALQQTVKKYAWPSYHKAPYTDAKPEYTAAIKAAIKKNQYVGGNSMPGIDCGGFITRVMIDSGYEPNYNFGGDQSKGAGSTLKQQPWLEKNWKKIDPKTTKDLQPGDVAINTTHTYMYVGKIDGFNSEFASASLESRAPMAGSEKSIDPDLTWYRKN